MSRALKENVNAKQIHLKKKSNLPKPDFADYRIITKNLVYVIGLSSYIANKDTLVKYEYFGQYGNITKIIVNRNKAYNQNSSHGPSFSAYVTYSKPCEASLAILSLDDTIVDNHLIRASFGTTKYCTFFLKNIECINKDCLFLHRIAEDSEIITREDLNTNKNIFIEQQLYAIKIADIYNPEVKKKLLANKKGKTMFPSIDSIYRSEIVIENDPIYQKSKISKKIYNEDEEKMDLLRSNPASSLTLTLTPTSQGDLMTNFEKKENNTETTSTSSKDDMNYTNISSLSEDTGSRNSNTKIISLKAFSQEVHTNIPQVEFKLYTCREHSRFSFGSEEKSEQECREVEIPNFVQQLIIKKIQTHKLAKNIKGMDDILYKDNTLETEYANKNSWAMFIIENKAKPLVSNSQDTTNYDKDLIDDFENINDFIFNRSINKKEY